MALFLEHKGLNIKYSHRDLKRHFPTRKDVFWRILRKNPLKRVGCSLIEEPPKTKKLYIVTPKGTAKVCIWGAETPEPIAIKFCLPGGVFP